VKAENKKSGFQLENRKNHLKYYDAKTLLINGRRRAAVRPDTEKNSRSKGGRMKALPAQQIKEGGLLGSEKGKGKHSPHLRRGPGTCAGGQKKPRKGLNTKLLVQGPSEGRTASLSAWKKVPSVGGCRRRGEKRD